MGLNSQPAFIYDYKYKFIDRVKVFGQLAYNRMWHITELLKKIVSFMVQASTQSSLVKSVDSDIDYSLHFNTFQIYIRDLALCLKIDVLS